MFRGIVPSSVARGAGALGRLVQRSMSELAAAHRLTGMSLAVWIQTFSDGSADLFCAVTLFESDVAELQASVATGEVFIVVDSRRLVIHLLPASRFHYCKRCQFILEPFDLVSSF